jgi:hypothetical protein
MQQFSDVANVTRESASFSAEGIAIPGRDRQQVRQQRDGLAHITKGRNPDVLRVFWGDREFRDGTEIQ